MSFPANTQNATTSIFPTHPTTPTPAPNTANALFAASLSDPNDPHGVSHRLALAVEDYAEANPHVYMPRVLIQMGKGMRSYYRNQRDGVDTHISSDDEDEEEQDEDEDEGEDGEGQIMYADKATQTTLSVASISAKDGGKKNKGQTKAGRETLADIFRSMDGSVDRCLARADTLQDNLKKVVAERKLAKRSLSPSVKGDAARKSKAEK